MSTRTFITTLLLLLLLGSVYLSQIQAQETDVCEDILLVGTIITDYDDCINNSPECINCDTGTNTQDDFLADGSLLTTNSDIESLMCPLVNCCSSCVEQAKAMAQCGVLPLCETMGITNCTLVCSLDRFPYGDGGVTRRVPFVIAVLAVIFTLLL